MTRPEKIDAKTRVARHRAAMRAKGYRLKQMWVRDTRSPEFLAEIRAACEAINASPFHAEDMAWVEAVSIPWDELPPYDASLPEPRKDG
jgi:hypothetical protein